MRKLIPVGVLVILVVGCSHGIIRPRVEDGIKAALPDYIGPAKEYTVRAEGSTTDMLNGLIALLHIEGKQVRIDPKLTVDRLVIDMHEVRYNSSRQLTSVGNTTFSASVLESAVNRYIEESRDADDLSVKLKKDKVLVEFVPNVLGVNVAVTVTGEPMMAKDSKVNFVADSGSVAHVPVPAYVVNKALERVNPILDMSLMKFPVALTGITIKDGAAVIKGSAEFKPAAAPKP